MYQTISGLGHIKLRAVDPRVARPMSSINNKEVEKLERPPTVQMTVNSNLDNEYATSEAITQPKQLALIEELEETKNQKKDIELELQQERIQEKKETMKQKAIKKQEKINKIKYENQKRKNDKFLASFEDKLNEKAEFEAKVMERGRNIKVGSKATKRSKKKPPKQTGTIEIQETVEVLNQHVETQENIQMEDD